MRYFFSSLVAVFLLGLSALPATADDWNDCLSADLSNPQSRIAACTRIINSQHHTPQQARRLPWVYSARALLYTHTARYEIAIADYDRAILLASQDPTYDRRILAAFRANRGSAYLRKGDYERARADYREAMNIDPRNDMAELGLQQLQMQLQADQQNRFLDNARKCLAAHDLTACDAALADNNLRIASTEERTRMVNIRDQALKAQQSSSGQRNENGALSLFRSTKSPEFILLAMFLVGVMYVVGQKVRGKIEEGSLGRQIAVGIAVSVLTGVVLKVLDLAGGEHLITFTVLGILVIAVSLFA
jgi:tetratricopeptide (TPR) repeat protein